MGRTEPLQSIHAFDKFTLIYNYLHEKQPFLRVSAFVGIY